MRGKKMIKIIEGYENYAVSSNGDVFSLRKNIKLKPIVKKTGYCEVCLVDENHKEKYFLVHRLVASAFCEKSKGATEVNHIDGNKQNNCYQNLEWVEHNANLKHAYKNGLREQDVSARKVIATNMVTGEEIVFSSIYRAAKANGISKGNVCMCCQGKRPYANGFYWRYAN